MVTQTNTKNTSKHGPRINQAKHKEPSSLTKELRERECTNQPKIEELTHKSAVESKAQISSLDPMKRTITAAQKELKEDAWDTLAQRNQPNLNVLKHQDKKVLKPTSHQTSINTTMPPTLSVRANTNSLKLRKNSLKELKLKLKSNALRKLWRRRDASLLSVSRDNLPSLMLMALVLSP
jgi:superoxide dismutase